jgi:hypothetical protein
MGTACGYQVPFLSLLQLLGYHGIQHACSLEFHHGLFELAERILRIENPVIFCVYKVVREPTGGGMAFKAGLKGGFY